MEASSAGALLPGGILGETARVGRSGHPRAAARSRTPSVPVTVRPSSRGNSSIACIDQEQFGPVLHAQGNRLSFAQVGRGGIEGGRGRHHIDPGGRVRQR